MADDDSKTDEEMPLVEHLRELRRRLIFSGVAILLAFVVCFAFAQPIYNFLAQPLADLWQGQEGRRMIATALHEQFFTQIKVAFFAAFCLAFPIIASQLWVFIAPGLYKREKQAFLPFLIATPVLILLGGSFVYYIVLPVAWELFASFEQLGDTSQLAIQLEPKINEYLSLVMRLIFAFGLSFELPVVLTLLARAGIVSSGGLKKKRRYAIVLAFVAAAILTPPDPLSQIGLAIPIIILYELSILSAQLIERARYKREEEVEEGDEPQDEQDAHNTK
ncbi:MAG: twin-arginine translocase subunit TatC [Pseudomonadota bacterium]